MALHPSRTGKLMVDTATVGYVTDWNVDAGIESVDVTGLGDSNRVFSKVLNNFSCSFTLIMDDTDTDQIAFRTAALSATGVVSDITIYSNATDYYTLPATAHVESYTESLPVGDVVRASVTIRANGATSYTEGA